MYPRAKNLALRNCLRLVHLWCFYLRRHEIVQLQPVIEMAMSAMNSEIIPSPIKRRGELPRANQSQIPK